VDRAITPKTTWNVDKSGAQLIAKMSGVPERFQECARCKERRDVPVLEPRSR
jgi:hypothetical protein